MAEADAHGVAMRSLHAFCDAKKIRGKPKSTSYLCTESVHIFNLSQYSSYMSIYVPCWEIVHEKGFIMVYSWSLYCGSWPTPRFTRYAVPSAMANPPN